MNEELRQRREALQDRLFQLIEADAPAAAIEAVLLEIEALTEQYRAQYLEQTLQQFMSIFDTPRPFPPPSGEGTTGPPEASGERGSPAERERDSPLHRHAQRRLQHRRQEFLATIFAAMMAGIADSADAPESGASEASGTHSTPTIHSPSDSDGAADPMSSPFIHELPQEEDETTITRHFVVNIGPLSGLMHNFQHLLEEMANSFPQQNLEDVMVPLPAELLDKIPIKPANDLSLLSALNNNCAICLTDICGEEVNDSESAQGPRGEPEATRLLPCKHLYHRECIDRWFSQNVCCPLCKQDIRDLLTPKTPS